MSDVEDIFLMGHHFEATNNDSGSGISKICCRFGFEDPSFAAWEKKAIAVGASEMG